MELQFLGHACFLLDDGSYKVLTDPFLSGTGQTALAETVEPDFIFGTHGHGDHVGDAVEISKRTGAPVCWAISASPDLKRSRLPSLLRVPSGNSPSTSPSRMTCMAVSIAVVSPVPRDTGNALSQRMTCFKTGISNSSAFAIKWI